jgi:hypothetical protein
LKKNFLDERGSSLHDLVLLNSQNWQRVSLSFSDPINWAANDRSSNSREEIPKVKWTSCQFLLLWAWWLWLPHSHHKVIYLWFVKWIKLSKQSVFIASTVTLVFPENAEVPLIRVVRDVSGSAANAGASTQTFNQQPGFGFGGLGGGFSGSAANAGASSQTFNQQPGFGFGGLGGGFGGSAANAGAQTQSFTQGGLGGGLSGSAANAGASTSPFNQGGLGGGFGGSAANAGAQTSTFTQGGFGGGISGSAANAGKIVDLSPISFDFKLHTSS